MKLFGRRSRGERAELARIASFETLAETQKHAEATDLPAPEPQIRVLSEEELHGDDSEDAAPEVVADPGDTDWRTSAGAPLSEDEAAERALPPAPHPLRPTIFPATAETVTSADAAPANVKVDTAPTKMDAVPVKAAEPAGPESVRGRGGRVASATGREAPAVIGADILIGGEEADLVPLIPDTKPEAESAELDDETAAVAAVDALRGACDLLLDRVQRMRTMRDGARFISAMIAVVAELDARYARDWGVVRRNGLEEVLQEVRAVVAEGDRFILESLENGHGGFTDDPFVRDLKTVALKDRPRIIAEYAIFLVFVYRCVLSQYLRPLENEPARLDEMMGRLDYLIDGVRELLIQHVNASIQG